MVQAVAEQRRGVRQGAAAAAEAVRQSPAATVEAVRQREAAKVREERERAAAVAELEAILSHPVSESDDDDSEPAAKPATAPRPDHYVVPSKFLPGGFTDKDIYREYNESEQRIDKQTAHSKEVTDKGPYKDRLYRARQNISNQTGQEDFRKMTPEEVWESGVASDLFLESEKAVVLADQRAMVEANQKRIAEESKAIRTQVEIKREMDWEAQGEALSAPEPIVQMFLAPALTRFAPLVASAFGGAQTGAVAGETYNAFAHGTGEDKAKTMASLAAMYFTHRAMRNLSAEPPPIPEGEAAPPASSPGEPTHGEPPPSAPSAPVKPVITAHADESGVTFHEVKHPTDVVRTPPSSGQRATPPTPAEPAPAPPSRRTVVSPPAKSPGRIPARPKSSQSSRRGKKGPITAAPKSEPPLPEGYEDMPEHTGVSETPTPPGSGTELAKTAAGNLAHRMAEILQRNPEVLDRLRKVTGSSQIFNRPLPEGLVPEYKIPHPDYPVHSRPRIDRLWRLGRTIYEIKPNTEEAERGAVQAMQYARWMEKFGELPPGGGQWDTEVIEYDQAALLKFLQDIGYLPK